MSRSGPPPAAVCLLLAAGLVAGEPAWDWLPHVADDDRVCEVRLTAVPGWEPIASAGLDSRIADGQIILRFEPRLVPRAALGGPDGAGLALRLPAPGQGRGLACDQLGRLRLDSDAAILAVPRREAAADRRWGILRAFERRRLPPCRLVLPPPPPAEAGLPALTRQIAAAQQLDPAGAGVLVRLSGDDRFAAWKHRDYRQALAWLVADLAARGASHVVLVEPCCPAVDEPLLAPLRAQVRDVAAAYRCPVLATAGLGEHALWELSPGLLGPGLNAQGEERAAALLQPWLATDTAAR